MTAPRRGRKPPSPQMARYSWHECRACFRGSVIIYLAAAEKYPIAEVQVDKTVKKIAVLVRDRQGEALRMAVGITLMDDVIDVYILDRKVEETEENSFNIETMKDLGMNVFTNYEGNRGITFFSTGEIAKKLLRYDHVLPY